ncbi:MAG: hypothetical protein VYE22_18515 [Myxococcota bacterium]|nr:hypothetical protein [Myxococcota bacterium]
MADASFDPGGYFEFDLAKGAVRARGGERVLVLSDDVLAPLISAAVEGGDLTAVRKMGRQLGDAVLGQLGGSAGERPIEEVLGHAAAILSLFGWGRLEMERWGDALVASLEALPALDDDHLGVAALLGGLLSALGGTEVACVPVGRGGRFMVVDPSVAQQIWKWARGGDDVGAIVSRLAPENA